MAQEFVNSKIQPGKVVVFIKPTCPYCRQTQEILSQFPFKEGILEFVDITATDDTEKIQDYLKQLTGARTVSLGFCPKRSRGKALPFLFLVRAVDSSACVFLYDTARARGSVAQGAGRAVQGGGGRLREDTAPLNRRRNCSPWSF